MWSAEDLAWLTEHYPGLKPIDDGNLEGSLSFQALYLDGQIHVRPSAEFIAAHSGKATYLCDTYKIRVVPTPDGICPSVYEIGGRIEAVAKRKDKQIIDLHVYPQVGALCLASSMQLGRAFAKKFSLQVFLDEFVVPFLFAQSHYALHDEWLWGELSHGYIGLLEWLGRRDSYGDRDIVGTYYALMKSDDRERAHALLAQRCRGHKPCPCGSGRKARDCCPELISAISRLRGAMSRGILTYTV
jgi:hypothetical protein